MAQKINDLLVQARQKIRAVWAKLAGFGPQGRTASSGQTRPADQTEIVVQRVGQAQPVTQPIRQRPKKRTRPIRRRSRQRVYRLAGYTTVSKINSRRKSERRQRFLRQLLLILLVILAVILLFRLYNPIKDLTEWYRIIGIKEIKDLAGRETSSSSQVISQTTSSISRAGSG